MQTAMVENPLREGLRLERVPAPCAMVIFGASGDLTRRKLMPALYNLAIEGLIPSGFSVVGYARRDLTTDMFRAQMRDGVDRYSRRRPVDPNVWETFEQGISYVDGNFEDPKDYRALGDELNRLDRERGTCGNRIFYLAAPPRMYRTIVDNLGVAGLVGEQNDE